MASSSSTGWTATPPTTEQDWRAVAAVLSRLHTLTRDRPQRPGFRATVDLLTHDHGGDVRLDLMPADAIRRCRAAWRTLIREPQSVVHGDPGAGNIRVSRQGAGIFDWDESRVDASILDLASLP
ncbi:MAG: phosphotransferase, partial [Dehalococcoidia bacterium]